MNDASSPKHMALLSSHSVEGAVLAAQVRLLVVEDYADTARILAKVLQRAGYTVKTATNAATALELAAGEPFDIVISDIGLPDMTGYDLMRQLSKQYGMKGIALTGCSTEEDIILGREAGFNEYLVKPVEMETLRATVLRLSQVEEVCPPPHQLLDGLIGKAHTDTVR